MIISRKSACCEVVFSLEIWLLNYDFKVEWGCNNFVCLKSSFRYSKVTLRRPLKHIRCCMKSQRSTPFYQRYICMHKQRYKHTESYFRFVVILFPHHTFFCQAFTTDFEVHWGQHPLRPELVESTYFLYEVRHCWYKGETNVWFLFLKFFFH